MTGSTIDRSSPIRTLVVLVLGLLMAGTTLALSTGPAEAVGGYRVAWTGGTLNARTGPSTSHGLVARYRDGTALDLRCWQRGQLINGRNNVWYQLNAPHRGAWVTASYVTTPRDPLPGLPQCGAPAARPAPAPQPAPAPRPPTGTYASRDRQLRLCTDLGNAHCVPAGMPTVSRNASIRMVCWQKGSWDTGDYRTDMWFWVTTPRGEGYVTASVVRNQTSVPACNANRRFVAAEAALARMGQRSASAGDRAQFSAGSWAPGPVGEWAGDCPKLPYVAWRAAGVTIPSSDAIANYRTWAGRNGGRLPTSAPPRGALVFWNVTSWGHTAIGVGNGFVATTNGLDHSNATNSVRPYTSTANYLGWVQPG